MLSAREQFEELLHNSMINFGFKGGSVLPYKLKYTLNDITVIIGGQFYYDSISVYCKSIEYKFNTFEEFFEHKLIKNQIRKSKLKKIYSKHI